MPTKRVEVIHTKELINYAFKELLLEKEFDRITVMDISSKAQINRATFIYTLKISKSSTRIIWSTSFTMSTSSCTI